MTHVAAYAQSTQWLCWVTGHLGHPQVTGTVCQVHTTSRAGRQLVGTGEQHRRQGGSCTSHVQMTLLAYGFGAQSGIRREVGSRRDTQRRAVGHNASRVMMEGQGVLQA